MKMKTTLSSLSPYSISSYGPKSDQIRRGTLYRRTTLGTAVLLTLLLSRASAWAGTVYWTGLAGDGLWGTASNWSSLTTPTFTDSVTNATTDTITLDNISNQMLSLTSNGNLTLTSSSIAFYNASISMAAGTTLSIDNGSFVDHYLAFGSPATTLSGFTLAFTNTGSGYNGSGGIGGGPGGLVLDATMTVTGKSTRLSTSDQAFSNATMLGSRLGGDWTIGNSVYGNVTTITNSGTMGTYGDALNDSSSMTIYAQYLNNTGIIEANANAGLGAGGYAQTYLSLAGYDSLRTTLGMIRAVGNNASLTLSTSTSIGDALPTAQLATVSAQNGGRLTLSGVIDNRGNTFTPSDYRDVASTVNLENLTLRGGDFAGSQGGAVGGLQLEGVHVIGDIGTGSNENINLTINGVTDFAVGTRVRIGYDSDLRIQNYTSPYTLQHLTLISDSANVEAVGDLTLGTDFSHEGRYTSFRAPSLTNLSHTNLDDISLSADTIVNKGRIAADGQRNGSSFIPITNGNNYSGSTLTNEDGALLSAVNGGRVYLTSENIKNSGEIMIGANSTMLLAQNYSLGTTLTQDAGLTTVNGVLQAENSAALFILNGGTLKGSGTIEPALIQNGGVIAPGNSPGTLTLTGSFTQNAGGMLLMEIASTTLYDQLVLSGASNTLEGVLEIQFVDGYQPQIGDNFNFFSDGSGQPITTNFTTIVLPSGYSGSFNSGGFTLSSTASPEPGALALIVLASPVLCLRRTFRK